MLACLELPTRFLSRPVLVVGNFVPSVNECCLINPMSPSRHSSSPISRYFRWVKLRQDFYYIGLHRIMGNSC